MIAVVDYRKGNLSSVQRGLQDAGLDARITDEAAAIARARAIVLPGVGSFADAAGSMEQLGQMEVLRQRIAAGVPFLGICLGMHLLFEGGSEHAAPGAPTPGLGVIPGTVDALPAADGAGRTYKIPHVGWNNVDQCVPGNPLFAGIADGEYFYFTHSYAAPPCSAAIATATHSVEFPCAVQVGEACFGVQFHPEKSSDAGTALLRNFAAIANRP